MPEIQQTHDNDIILVQNIDTNCNMVTSEVVKRTLQQPSPHGGVQTYYEEEEVTCDHALHFEVRWGGKPFRIPPGEVRKMPRYVAKHYAKHLMMHILQKLEAKTKTKGLTQNRAEQKKILESIMIGVDTYYNQPIDFSEAERAYNEFKAMNADDPTSPASNLGKVSDVVDEVEVPVAPETMPEPKVPDMDMPPTEETDSPAGPTEGSDPFADLTKAQLLAEAESLDLPANDKMNKTEIINLIKKNFA